MPAILITQCVQNDFVRPLGVGEGLPNLVHVGRLEAERLCGPAGSLAPFLTLAHGVAPDRLAIVHVVDRHDPQEHARHFDLFRPHCVAGSEGAELVAPVSRLATERPNTFLVEAGDLNDFEDSSLREILREAAGEDDPAEVAIAVIGVWTDAKVSFLLYDLRTRLRARRLATCSALTASRSMESHFKALESVRGILGVDVHHSPGSLLSWLVEDAEVPLPEVGGVPLAGQLESESSSASILLGSVVAEPNSVELVPLGGGFSGAKVFLATESGAPPFVLKVGRREELARERFGNERIGRILGDVVPSLVAYREGRDLAAMRVELAHGRDSSTTSPSTLKATYEEEPGDEVTSLLEETLAEVLEGPLGRLYRNAEKDNADLLETYGFVDSAGRPAFGDSVERKAREVAQGNGFGSVEEALEVDVAGRAWMAPARFYREVLADLTLVREVLSSLVHGDLNLANVLLTRSRGNGKLHRVWIIDFARLGRMPVLTDVAKLENDLSYIMLPLHGEEAYVRALTLQQERLSGETLEVPHLRSLAVSPTEQRHVRLVHRLRAIAARLDPRGVEAMDQYRVALLRYAAHTLGFDEPNLLQRRLALAGCAQLAAHVASM